MKWHGSAPSNIALIKYMGKEDSTLNLPTNPSLSFRLDHLISEVELELSDQDHWEPLDDFQLSPRGQERFLNHLRFLKSKFECDRYFTVRSRNNFSANCGLASSASSFAALTLAAVKAICESSSQPLPGIDDIAQLSRQGSGSSCRSFYGPYALWDSENVSALPLPYHDLKHQIITVSTDPKSVSSSQAHRLVTSSLYFSGRIERAVHRLKQLVSSMETKDWNSSYRLVWDEFEDMHQLFETSEPAFTYRTAKTHALLDYLKEYWENSGDGPLVTMDAGPNIHLLYRGDQEMIDRGIFDNIMSSLS